VYLNKLCGQVTGTGRQLVEWRYYAAPVPQGVTPAEQRKYWMQQQFFQAIQRHGKAVVRLGRFQKDPTSGALREKGVDVLIAVELIHLAHQDRYDIAIVMSADGDLVPAVDVVRQHFRRREVALPAAAPGYHIRQAADAFIEITRRMYEAVSIR
jgi:uncharacterized LabA/DUF88 family protein